MTYTISIINNYSYPLDEQKRTEGYEEQLLCYGYSAHVRKHPTLPFDFYIKDILSGGDFNIDTIVPQYSYNNNIFKLTNNTEIDNKTAPPLLFSWWDNVLKENRLLVDAVITGNYYVYISFSGESNNVMAVKLKKLCDKFIIENPSPDDVNAGTYYKSTTPDRINYEGIIDKIVDLFPNVSVWKFNSRVAGNFIDKVEKQIKLSPNYRAILITKLFNKL